MSVLSNCELILWNLPKGEDAILMIDSVRRAMADCDLNPERAEDVPPSTAFRRAGQAVKDKAILVRFWKRQADDALCLQVDAEAEKEDGKLHRQTRCVYQLNEEADNVELASGTTISEIPSAYTMARRHYIGGDISKVITAVLTMDGLGAYSPKKTGGVYFVPMRPEAPDLLDRLERFCRLVGVRLLRYSVPDLAAQREEIAEAVADAMDRDLAAHEEAIAAYTVETKGGHLENRKQRLDDQEKLICQLAGLLAGKQADMVAKINDMRQKLDAMAKQIEEHRSSAAAAPRRRIVTGGAA